MQTIAAGATYSLGSGKCVAWGDNGYRQCDIPPIPENTQVVQVATRDW